MSSWWPLIKIVPIKTNFTFVPFAKFAGILSVLAVAGSLFLTLTPFKGPCGGLNCGVDFRGGVVLEVNTSPDPIDLATLRATVSELDLGDVNVQGFGLPGQETTQAMVNFALPDDTEAEDITHDVEAAITAALGDNVTFAPAAEVGSKISQELLIKGISALGVAVFLMLIYIWFRFEWQFSLGAVAGLLHDTILVFGLFAITGMEFSLNAVAAVLTVIGYSMNDTVVVYDRMRENLRKYKKMPFDEMVDLSLNQTLPRTLMTSISTLAALLALYIFGGEVLRGFTFIMIFGVLVGTYSSIFIGAPLLSFMGAYVDRTPKPGPGDVPAEADGTQP